MNIEKLKEQIRKDLGLESVQESYVTEPKVFDLSTELLTAKQKDAHAEIYQDFSEKLNTISAELDVADKDGANPNYCGFRCLKIDEVRNLNASYLHAYHFGNISDVKSVVTMDSMAFLRLERDFGGFDDWQKDFIACALSSRGGYAVTVFSIPLRRYLNVIVDESNIGIPMGAVPIICLCVQPEAYFRDYLNDRKSYVYAMMKEIKWDVIEERIKKAEKVAKAFGNGGQS